MKLKKITSTILSVALATTLFAGCDSSKDNSDPIVMGIFDMPTLYLMQTFDDMGYFDANDADVDFKYFPVYSDAITAFNTKNVDMICYAIPECVAPIVNGIDCKVIGVFDTSYGLDGVAALEGIDTVSDLKGKNVATEIGTVDHLLLQRALELNGLSESDVNLINMSAGDAAAAMKGGSLDAVSTWEPQLSVAAECGSIIYSTIDDPDLIVDAFVIHNDVLDAQYDNAKAILKTWYDGVEEYQADSEKFTAEAAKKGNLTVEEFDALMSSVNLLSLDDNKEKFTKGEDDMKYLNVLLPEVGSFLYEGELIDKELTEEMISNMLDSRIVDELAG